MVRTLLGLIHTCRNELGSMDTFLREQQVNVVSLVCVGSAVEMVQTSFFVLCHIGHDYTATLVTWFNHNDMFFFECDQSF